MLRKMSKTTGLIWLCVLVPLFAHAQAADSTARITIDRDLATVSQLLEDITAQSGMQFSFNPRFVNVDEQIAFSCRNLRLPQALAQLCAQVFLNYDIVEGQIVITPMDAAQLPVYMLTGYVSDSASAEVLISATVAAGTGSYGTATNDFGYYALPLRRGTHKLIFSYLGFKQTVLEVDLKKNETRNVALPPSASALPEIEIHSVSQSPGNDDLGKMTLRPEDVNMLPELAGESGLVKNLEHLPGIKQHSDVSAFFYVRGGERDQNVIFIDDAPIYNPSHLLGLSSMVIPDFAQQITVYKSDMPANLGDRLASIVSIRTRDGNLNRFRMSGALSPFVNRLSVEIPLVKQRSSLFASYRRSAYELFYRRANPDISLFFQDFHLKWNYRANDKNRFFVTVIGSNDNFSGGTGEVSSILWGNFAATLRWNRVLGPRLFSNTTLYTGNYAYYVNYPPNQWKSELGTLSLKSDFTHFISQSATAKFGLEIQGYFTTPGRLTLESTTSALPDIKRNYGRKTVLYYQGDLQVNDKLKFNAGLRLISWQNTGPATYYTYDDQYAPVEKVDAPEGVYQSYLNLDPRVSLAIALSRDQGIKLSYGIYHQYLQLISNSVSPYTAMEIWLTASPNIRPQRSQQVSLDYGRQWDDHTELNLAAYYKSSNHQIDLDGHATIYLNEQLEGALRFGSSEAFGLECRFAHTFGKLDASLAYTWSRVFRTTPDLNTGLRYPALQDRPHDLSLIAHYMFSPRFSVTGFWKSSSGSPFTSPTGFYTFNGQSIPVYGERNNDRLPPYHRLDVSCIWKLNKDLSKRFQHSLTLSIFNVIGYKNIYAIKFNKLYDADFFPETPSNVFGENVLSPSQTESIQVLPSLTYKFEF